MRQASEQYFTSCQTFSHFFRHCIGRKQTTQSFSGKFDLLTRFLLIALLTPLAASNKVVFAKHDAIVAQEGVAHAEVKIHVRHHEIPKYADDEASFDDLKARVEKTLAFLNSIDAEKYVGAQERIVKISVAGQPVELDGISYVRDFVMPNVYFHLSMSYAILRHNGLVIGKNDFVGRA